MYSGVKPVCIQQTTKHCSDRTYLYFYFYYYYNVEMRTNIVTNTGPANNTQIQCNCI